MSYNHPVKRLVRRVLGLTPCGCGCDVVYTRKHHGIYFSELGGAGKWAMRDPDGD